MIAIAVLCTVFVASAVDALAVAVWLTREVRYRRLARRLNRPAEP